MDEVFFTEIIMKLHSHYEKTIMKMKMDRKRRRVMKRSTICWIWIVVTVLLILLAITVIGDLPTAVIASVFIVLLSYALFRWLCNVEPLE